MEERVIIRMMVVRIMRIVLKKGRMICITTVMKLQVKKSKKNQWGSKMDKMEKITKMEIKMK